MAEQRTPDDDERPALFAEPFEECDEIDENWQPPALPPLSAEEIAREEQFAESAAHARNEIERALAEGAERQHEETSEETSEDAPTAPIRLDD